MPKGVPNKRYTPEFKKLVIETMQEEKLSYSETCRRFEVNSRDQIKSWERIYLEEGAEGFAVERDGKRYPVISIIAESSYPTIFGSAENVKAFYRELAARFRKAGFGGMALYINWPVKGIGDMTADGVLRYTTSYTPNYTVTDRTGKYTYADLVANFKPPKKGNVIISVGTSVHTQRPHESGWICPGSTPDLFAQYMQKAVAQLEKYPALPQVIMCYNMSEWAEGGPGLVPNVRDRFGYLEAIRDAVVKK